MDDGFENSDFPDPQAKPQRGNDDSDDEDVGQNYSHIQKKIPSRGAKEFEPHGSNTQSQALQRSRASMYDVLMQERVHPRDVGTGVWDPLEKGAWVLREGKWAYGLGSSRKIQLSSVDDDGNPILISRTLLYLLPEEALFLVERGNIQIRFPGEARLDESGPLLSVQACHAMFIGNAGLSLEHYTVYQHLRRAGYYVLRAIDNWQNFPKTSSTLWETLFRKWSYQPLKNWTDQDHLERRKLGPLVSPTSSYRSYRDVYKQTTFKSINSRSQTKDLLDPTSISGPHITYHVYKPSTAFKKTSLGAPDYYIFVINARELGLLKEQDLDLLLRQVPHFSSNPSTNVYSQLKAGKNVIMAIVDQGITSFLNMTDASFGSYPLWARPLPQKPTAKRSTHKGRHRANR